jgi:hypothetical protein
VPELVELQTTKEISMLPEKKTNTNIGVGVGILLQVIGRILTDNGPGGVVLGIILILVGLGAFVWGCMNYAEGKGHSKHLGWLGLLTCIGLIILACLPDHHKEPK